MTFSKTYSKKSPRQKWDYIVIGSGMGGMTCAAFLAKLGKKVLVLEQHYVPGGYTHTFRRKHWQWDVGVHAVGEVTEHTLPGRILSNLTDGRLQWASLGPVYDEFHFPGPFRIDFPDNPQQFVANLKNAFPQESRAIDQYLQYVRRVANAMRRYYLGRIIPGNAGKLCQNFLAAKANKYLQQNTKKVLDTLTDNDRLKTVIASQWGYYGSTPANSSFAIQALVARHFTYGGYYPVGGSAQIAEQLLRTVAEQGGWTRVRSEVSQIIIEKKQAKGVQLLDGEIIYADKIVSAIGALETIERLIAKGHVHPKWSGKIQKLKPSPAHLCLYMGFKGDISKAGASASNKWFWKTWDCEFGDWNFEDPKSEAPVLYTSFPSLKDPKHQPGEQQYHTGEIVTFAPYHVFEKWKDQRVMKRDPEYKKIKQELSERMLNQFFEYMPDLKPMLAYSELSTPLSNIHYTRSMYGAIYGIEPTPQRFKNPWLKPHTPIKNLYMSGSDVATVGVIGAMVGGVLTTLAAEPMKSFGFLKKCRKKRT